MNVLSESERQEIQLVVDAYAVAPETHAFPGELAQVAAKAKAIPVYADIGGALLLDSMGRILSVSTNEPWNASTEVEEETDENWRAVALVSAAERYPSLQFLRPLRPSTAIDCPACGGSGRVLIAAAQARCGRCWSRGWIESGLANPSMQPTGFARG